jgi:hypothetical protein
MKYCEVDKKMKREIRNDIRKHTLEMIQKILEKTKSTKRIKREMGEGKLWMMGAKDKNGEITRTRASIVEVATDFYEQLYHSNTNIKHRYLQKMEEEEEMPPILKGEVETAIKHLKKQ